MAAMPSAVPIKNSRYPTADAPSMTLTRTNGRGILRIRKTASVPLRRSNPMSRLIRSPPHPFTWRGPIHRPMANAVEALARQPVIA